MPICDSDLTHCAQTVEAGDPARFRAAMAMPVAARRRVLPIFAVNVEIARAAWVSAEPLINQMRLQFWDDFAAALAKGASLPAHALARPLARVLPPGGAAELQAIVAARQWDLGQRRFDSDAALIAHLRAGQAQVMILSARALGASPSAALHDFALASALASWLVAVPALRAQNCQPLPRKDAPALRALVSIGLKARARAAQRRAEIARTARPALLPGWQSGAVLHRAMREPGAIADGNLLPGPLRSSLGLSWQAATGRW